MALSIVNRALRRATNLYWQHMPRLTLRRFTTQLENVNIDRPIFLLGAQGGGLTLLSRILRRHPDVVSCSGNNKFWAGRDELQNVYFEQLPTSLRLLNRNWLTKSVQSDTCHPVYGYDVGWNYATDPILTSYRRTEKDFAQDECESLRNIIKTIIRTYSLTGSPRFVDKSQSYTLKTPLIKRCLPDAKFILVARNPYALCFGRSLCSVSRKSVSSKHVLQTNPEDDLRSKCNHYANTFLVALQDLSSINHLFIRYEDFLKHPETWMVEILDYLDLPASHNLLPSAHDRIPFGSVSMEKWFPMVNDVNSKYLNQLSEHPRLIGIMEDTLGPIAARLGYSPDQNVD